MKFSCLKENLAKAMANVNYAVANRTAMPITKNVLMNVKDGRLRLNATNLELSITTSIPVIIEEEGDFTVPARLLTEFVNSLPSERIDFELPPETGLLHLNCLKADAHIHGSPATDFPPVPSIEDGNAASIDPHELQKAISRVCLAAATEDSRPILTGAKVTSDGDSYTMAAADGFRLAIHHGSLEAAPQEDLNAIIPAHTLTQLSRLLAGQEDPIQIMMAPTRNQVLFRTSDTEVVSQILQGDFPNYESLIPNAYTTRIELDPTELGRASKTAAIFAKEGSNIIRLQVLPPTPEHPDAPATAFISSQSEEVGDNVDEISVSALDGTEAKIAFNYSYLQDVIGVLERDTIAVEMTTPSSPAVFKFTGEAENSYLHIVMPMFVQW